MAFLLLLATTAAADPATQPHKTTLAVLPFFSASDKDKPLAEKMRFAVSQKMSNDANGGNGGGGAGQFDRLDNVQVEQIISALQLPWETYTPDNLPGDDDLQKLLSTLNVDKTIMGWVKSRTLTLRLYDGQILSKTASVEIPSDEESPRAAVEKILTELTGATFAKLRLVEADHSNPVIEKRFAERPNLVPDPSFELAAAAPDHVAVNWHKILASEDVPVRLISAADAERVPEDSVVIVPKSAAGDRNETNGHCLMMRMSKNIAENNGLACISTWIPVDNNTKYRFAVRYLSKGPTARLFLKGFGYLPDQYGGGAKKNDPEATRRQFYEAEVLPRKKNTSWETIDMDITPSPLKPTYPKIEWMRLDLYVYLTPGDIFFDDVTLKKMDP
ncbi:MAG TPA: hypothetical protein VM008_11070 [Phycisphaerae bacterium]|nr:hypothetical protein [Phycisphaerae bacterium]